MSVLKQNENKIKIDEKDIRTIISCGSGNGGQNKNRRHTAVDLVHIPTGIKVHCENQRTQEQNKKIALDTLTQRVEFFYENKSLNSVNDHRKGQIGSGYRGDKIRTYNIKNDIVIDHRTNKKTSYKRFALGIIKF